MNPKTEIMDEVALTRALTRMTHEIIEKNQGVSNICLLGIKSRGVPLAKRIGENIKRFEGIDVPIGHLDITLHRDDLTKEEKEVKNTDCYFPCDVTGKTVIIIDDVLYTGRTVRAAIECIFQSARPSVVELAVLVDRGHRELPIRPDFIGKNVPTSSNEKIAVMLKETDDIDGVYIY